MANFEQWAGFKGRKWTHSVDVRDFIQENYTPYEGDEAFLEGPTEATDKLWGRLQELQKEERAKGGVLDMETEVDIRVFFQKRIRLFDERVSFFFFHTDIHDSHTRIFNADNVFHIDGTHHGKLHQMGRSCINIRTAVDQKGYTVCFEINTFIGSCQFRFIRCIK